MGRYPSAWQSGLDASREAQRERPTVTDFDDGDISVRLNGKELRGWSYKDDDERRLKMLLAREYVEGWCDAALPRS